jgi:hypothetical protein
MSRARPARPTRRAIIAITVAALCGTLVALSLHISLLRTARLDAARTHQVMATVLEPAVPERGRPAIGEWITADGSHRVGVIPAPPDRTAGTGQPIWIDDAGRITAQPKSALHRATQSALAGVAVAASIVLLTRRGPRQDDPVAMEWKNVAGDWQRRHL